MSENVEINNLENAPSCLHCRVHDSKIQYQEIFDEVGIEIEIPELLEKYFKIKCKPDAKRQQLICLECLNTLIRFFDIDELEREQNAANARKKKREEVIIVLSPPAAAEKHKLRNEKPAKKQHATTKLTARTNEKSPKPATPPGPAPPPVKSPPAEKSLPESAAIRVTRGRNATSKRLIVRTTKASELPQEAVKRRVSIEASGGDQEQISELIRDILDDEQSPADDRFVEAAATVRQLEKQDEEQQQQQQEQLEEDALQQEEERQQLDKEAAEEDEAMEEQHIVLEEQDNNDEMEFLLEREDSSSELDVRHFKVERKRKRLSTQSQNESQSDDGSFKVEPFNFVLIKENDNIGDLYEYLSTVVKTCFETLLFDWATVCRHCSLKCSTYESLLSHMLKRHELPGERYDCPIDGCTTQLRGVSFLAMHLVVLHAPVSEIPIYGSCPECNMTFSSILQYNKHSCAHVIKKRRGIRLYCEMCGLEFPSWKRFNFHNQFHLERHRPRACFVCSYADNNIDDLFHHLNYAHEPEGTLFCDICDRNFRDPAVFVEHNKSHANVGHNTYSCAECNVNFETRGRLNGHLRSAHGSVISCEMCSREFATEATYNVHMKSHLIIERQVHVCNNCGLISEHNDKLLAHVTNEDSSCFGRDINVEVLRNAYACEYCSSYFKQKTDLSAHRESGVHKDGLFWCQPCNKEFTDMKLYRHHLRNYQQLRTDVAHRKLEICLHYMCDYEDCMESYINWNSLYTHKRRTHDVAEKQEPKTKDNEWICQFCQKVCRSKMSLSVHVARSHNNNNVVCSLCNASYKNKEALQKHHAYWHEPMECPTCFKLVKNRRNFDTHMNVVHSNNKRYTCSECQKGFYHKSEMVAHQRLHAQMFSCEECNFTTRNKKSLSVHVMGQHLKRFAFECKVCEKRFGRRQGLSNHMQRVHGSRYTCRDFIDDGCSKSFETTARLNVHVRKVHNSSILLADDPAKAEEGEEEEEDEEEVLTSDGPSTSKKRFIEIEVIDEAAAAEDNESFTGSEILEEFQEIKEAESQPKKRQKRS